jgi:hypothetical protein
LEPRNSDSKARSVRERDGAIGIYRNDSQLLGDPFGPACTICPKARHNGEGARLHPNGLPTDDGSAYIAQ